MPTGLVVKNGSNTRSRFCGSMPRPVSRIAMDATSPPLAHGNFATAPTVYRGPYEYSFPGHEFDYFPQNVPEPAGPPPAAPEGGGGIQQTAVAQKEA